MLAPLVSCFVCVCVWVTSISWCQAVIDALKHLHPYLGKVKKEIMSCVQDTCWFVTCLCMNIDNLWSRNDCFLAEAAVATVIYHSTAKLMISLRVAPIFPITLWMPAPPSPALKIKRKKQPSSINCFFTTTRQMIRDLRLAIRRSSIKKSSSIYRTFSPLLCLSHHQLWECFKVKYRIALSCTPIVFCSSSTRFDYSSLLLLSFHLLSLPSSISIQFYPHFTFFPTRFFSSYKFIIIIIFFKSVLLSNV